jgi:diguanylate cyclase
MSRNSGTGLEFVKRIYLPRIFGMALAFPAVGAVLYQQQAPWHVWLFAVFCGFIWPHLAYLIAAKSERPTLAEYRNLICDSVLAGLWVPLMSFNLLPSLVLLTMASLDNMAVGGWRLFAKGLFAAAVSILIGWQWIVFLWDDYSIWLEPNLLTLTAAAPIMVAFPLAIGVITFALSRRLLRQREELLRIGRTDGLSQLNNRRFWEESVFQEFERHKRSGSPLSLIMIDIDHFKQVNDEYGHVAGDQMIREISDLLSAAVRQSDVVGRYGGEEFGLMLPDTGIKGALQFAERLRLGIEALTIKPYGVGCTISLGVAEADSQVRKYRDLIECADKSLYAAKHAGRNVVVAYEPE